MIPDEDEGDGPAGENPDQDPEVEIKNAADSAQIKADRKEQRRTKGEAQQFWAGVFATKIGRREMWNLLMQAGTFQTQFACGPNGFPQVEATWFKAGAADYGLRLYHTWLLNEPEGVRQMHVENDARWAKPKRRQKED